MSAKPAVFRNEPFTFIEGLTFTAYIFEHDPDNVWFTLNQVADVLKLSSPTRAAEWVGEEDTSYEIIPASNGGLYRSRMVSEPGLYRLVLRSNLSEAKAFERKVLDEIVPSILVTGAYFADGREG